MLEDIETNDMNDSSKESESTKVETTADDKNVEAHDNTELAGEIVDNETRRPDEKVPMFAIEPKKDGCARDDNMLLLSKKVGFYGLISCLLLSILFGAITKLWANSLNLLFMGLALLAYSVQNILHLVAIKKCNCTSCQAEQHKVKMLMIASLIGTSVLIVLYGLKQGGIF